MPRLLVFHSGDPACRTCQMAMVAAEAMQEKFGSRLEVAVYRNDSEEARAFLLKGAANVFLDGEWVPLETAISEKRMTAYLEERLGE